MGYKKKKKKKFKWEDEIHLTVFTIYRIANRNKLTPIMLVNPKYQDIKEKLDEASVAYDLVRAKEKISWYQLNSILLIMILG